MLGWLDIAPNERNINRFKLATKIPFMDGNTDYHYLFLFAAA
jgi:hypothetical protein